MDITHEDGWMSFTINGGGGPTFFQQCAADGVETQITETKSACKERREYTNGISQVQSRETKDEDR